VTQYEVDLDGIDSAGTGGNDLMELICQLDAQDDTEKMILDDFIDGLIWKLFKEKWNKFGFRVWCCVIALDTMYTVPLIIFCMMLKEEVQGASHVLAGVKVTDIMGIAVLAAIGCEFALELMFAYKWWASAHARPQPSVTPLACVSLLLNRLKNYNNPTGERGARSVGMQIASLLRWQSSFQLVSRARLEPQTLRGTSSYALLDVFLRHKSGSGKRLSASCSRGQAAC
jgi:hypothetical protein